MTIALPGSIIGNAQTPLLQTYLAGQIARTMVVFEVDEVVVFGEGGGGEGRSQNGRWDLFLINVLSYLETPQYLRKSLFPIMKELRHIGIVAPLDTPHHMRREEWSRYREGVVCKNKIQKDGKAGTARHSMVNVGLWQPVKVDRALKEGIRCTVDLGTSPAEFKSKKSKAVAKIVSPDAPRKAGQYWGYRTRLAPSISKVFSECPYPGGYDCTIGTSERGTNVYDPDLVIEGINEAEHILVVFGGVHGLEESVESDPDVLVDSPAALFEYYLNTCPHQGSRTIRTEEAILISMAGIQHHMAKAPWATTTTN